MQKNIIYIALLLLGAWSLQSCGADKNKPQQETPGESPAENVTQHIALSKEQIREAGISWATAGTRMAVTSLPVSGEIRLHNEHIATVSAFSEGIVTELRTGLNKQVSKGAVLAVIRKPDLVDMQQNYLETESRLTFLEAEYERYKTLKDENATALKNFQKAEAERREAITRKEALAAKLRLFQIQPEKLTTANIRSELVLTAPFSGIVTRTFLTHGSAVQAGTPVCEVMNTAEMHADLFVFEKDLSKVRIDQQVSLQLQGGETLTARIFSIDPVLDPEKQAVRLHARFIARNNATLVNGAYLQGRIELQAGMTPQTALPESAVIQEENGYYAFLLEKEIEEQVLFKKVAVDVLPATDGYLVISTKESIPAQAQWVLKGAYYVAAQARVSELAEE